MAEASADAKGPVDPQAPQSDTNTNVSILDNIRASLKRKDDTSRFVGLTMLRTFLDSSSELKDDEAIISSLWDAISPKFLDRLLKSKGSQNDQQSTLDLGVLVIHKFTQLLPEESKRDKKLVGRIPVLVATVLRSSEETTQLIIQTLLELVAFSEGAKSFIAIEDPSPLIEIAPSQPLVLEVFDLAWINCMAGSTDRTSLRPVIDESIKGLVSSFKGTDGVTLLRFLGNFLRRSHPEGLPLNPTWIKPIVNYTRDLLTNKPNPEARNSYTLVSASLLEVYPTEASRLLFTNDIKADRPFAYLFITLVLTEIRAVTPRLLSLLNDPSYPDTAKRLGSAFDIITHFVGYLIRAMDATADGQDDPSLMPAEYLLKLRTSISETMSLAIEFLRDRYDASVAGAMGLHPDARPNAPDQWQDTLPITWDSSKDVIDNDPLILAEIRALAIWLREDDNKLLRKEAAGLTDMLMDLYQASAPERLDFRSPILVALEGVVFENKGVDAFGVNGGWKILSHDLVKILQGVPSARDDRESSRGMEIVRILLPFSEAEENGTEEDWMGLVTAIAAWAPPDGAQPLVDLEMEAAVLQLATSLLTNAHEGMRKRYVHSTAAIVEIARHLRDQVDEGHGSLRESLDDVVVTLGSL
ncbi:hypothetical protein BN1723_007757 [Verticillium longisporum]|uniref:DUF1941 family protein n=2 Tax=Verticillium longisporum TaxID=100787 RepID=A0A0G4NMT7_VERLO|nr:hypothetical protein HYQ44_010020 [Verticillium longisporum]CRK47777.1 hypothetical protein BN1723_007757 [Verticillium longisporum]